jgi:cysteine synthase
LEIALIIGRQNRVRTQTAQQIFADHPGIGMVDKFVSVRLYEAKLGVRELLDREGMGTGLSTGANIAARLKLAREMGGPPGRRGIGVAARAAALEAVEQAAAKRHA